MKWMAEYHIALWSLQLPRSLYLSIYVCPNKGRVNGSGPTQEWRTPGIYTQLVTRKREGVSGDLLALGHQSLLLKGAKGGFGISWRMPWWGDSRRHQNPIREVAPHFETDVQLQCVRKPDSTQTDSCQRGCLPSFFYSWNLDIGEEKSLHWGRECSRKARDHSSGAPTFQCSQTRQRSSFMLLAGLAGGGPADGAVKRRSWQMARDLSLWLLWGPPEDSIYLQFTSLCALPHRAWVQPSCHLPSHQGTDVPQMLPSTIPPGNWGPCACAGEGALVLAAFLFPTEGADWRFCSPRCLRSGSPACKASF